MNAATFINILQERDAVLSPEHTRALEDIIAEYPFFQAARALHVKGLQRLNSNAYAKALQVTAACTADREVLFDYINGEDFVQHAIANRIAARIPKSEVKRKLSGAGSFCEPVSDKRDAGVSLPAPEEAQGRPVEEGRRLTRDVSPVSEGSVANRNKERHSFLEWLQFTEPSSIGMSAKVREVLKRKERFALLDKFIESNPKIVPKEGIKIKVDLEASAQIEKRALMTETLARVYVEQKKYNKALQVFKILSLKYPEKSGFFADQIRAVEQLQKENE